MSCIKKGGGPRKKRHFFPFSFAGPFSSSATTLHHFHKKRTKYKYKPFPTLKKIIYKLPLFDPFPSQKEKEKSPETFSPQYCCREPVKHGYTLSQINLYRTSRPLGDSRLLSLIRPTARSFSLCLRFFVDRKDINPMSKGPFPQVRTIRKGEDIGNR